MSETVKTPMTDGEKVRKRRHQIRVLDDVGEEMVRAKEELEKGDLDGCVVALRNVIEDASRIMWEIEEEEEILNSKLVGDVPR